jgi:hypothetical protein
MTTLGIQPNGADVRRMNGKDETANAYVRYFSTLLRALTVPGAPNISAPMGATVMFQKIVHDGLVGHSFLSAHVVTFDITHGEMIFGQ